MDNKDFRDAFSVVRASDELRLEVFNMTTNTGKRYNKTIRRVLIAAAIIALLATTALAAPEIVNAIRGGSTEYSSGGHNKAEWMQNSDILYDSYEVYLELELEPDAPDDVLIHYLPEIPTGYDQYVGFQSDIERLYQWKKGEKGYYGNYADEIGFTQWPGDFWNRRAAMGIKRAWTVMVPQGTKPVEKLVELGGVSGYLVESAAGQGSRLFFWSDGDYVFRLEVPDEYTDGQLAELIESVHVVENIDPYIFND